MNDLPAPHNEVVKALAEMLADPTPQSQVGSPQALAAARSRHAAVAAVFKAAEQALKDACANLALHTNWNLVDRALLAEQDTGLGWAAAYRLNEHVRSLGGARNAEGLAPVRAHCTKKYATLGGGPNAVRIADDEYLIVCFHDEANGVVADADNGGAAHGETSTLGGDAALSVAGAA